MENGNIHIATATYTGNLESYIPEREVVIQFKKLNENAVIPTKATEFSAGYDLTSPIDCVVEPRSNKLIMTNIAMAWNNPNFYVKLHSRSGIANKHNVTVEGGVIDYDYRKNVGVILQNTTDIPFVVNAGDRIAQAILTRIADDRSEVVEDFTFYFLESKRDGGFGSTGRC